MKIGKYIFPLLLVLSSCNDFLDYKDKDKVIPSTLSEYEELIFGELIAKESGDACYNLMMMSDDMGDVILGSEEDAREDYYSWYSWAKEPQLKKSGDEMIDPAWEFLYHKVIMCNVIEEKVGEIVDDLQGVKFRLLGEVQAIRAMSYWYLVNMYGEPWRSTEQAKTAMGVPVNTETNILNKTYTRERLAINYRLMEEDLMNAIANFEKGEQKNTVFRPNTEIVRLFLSRIYLEQQRYEDVIAVCSDLLESTNKKVMSYERMKISSDNYSTDTPVIHRDGDNLLFSWWNRNTIPGFTYNKYGVGRYCVSQELRDSISKNPDDIRGKTYTFWEYGGQALCKYKMVESKCYGMNYRIEEVLFNRAEAYLKMGEKDLALADLTKVYEQRINPSGNRVLEAATDAEAMDIFRREKRFEFCFEDIRWFDIRRWQLRVEHQYHDLNSKDDYQTFILEAGSPNYILSLPMDIQRINFEIEQPERVETIVK